MGYNRMHMHALDCRNFVLLGLISVSLAATSPATQPLSLETRASAAFARGEYGAAMVLLTKLSVELKDQPDKLGPVEEQIKVCKTQLENAGALAPTTVPTAAERKPHAPPKDGEVRDLQIKDLGNFEYDADKGGNIPADVMALSGSKVRLHGYMVPMDQAENVTQFALVPSLFACCYGQPPQLQHTLVCNAPKGKAVSYYPDEILVEGTLKVEEKKDDGFIVSIFEIDVSSVKPAGK
jgi:hypothetical protein